MSANSKIPLSYVTVDVLLDTVQALVDHFESKINALATGMKSSQSNKAADQ